MYITSVPVLQQGDIFKIRCHLIPFKFVRRLRMFQNHCDELICFISVTMTARQVSGLFGLGTLQNRYNELVSFRIVTMSGYVLGALQ